MEKIYGYKEKDIVGLAKFLKERGAGGERKLFPKSFLSPQEFYLARVSGSA